MPRLSTRLLAAYTAWKAPATSPQRANLRRRASRPTGLGRPRHGGRPLRVGGASTPVQVDIRYDWRQTIPAAVVAVASIASVVFVAVGLYITNDANRGQQRLNERGQITVRFG